MSLLEDFWTYCQCYEITRTNAIWSAIGGMAAVVNRKCYIMHGDLKIHCGMYICLVGEPGTKKTTPKDFIRDLVIQAAPEYPIGPDQQSREDIVKFMASDECMNSYKDKEDKIHELRVYCFFIDEFKNFISYNALGMSAFLTNIYGRDKFDASTLKRSLEIINHPCINILACENTEWIVDNIKSNIISGGLGRRMAFIHVTEKAPPKPTIVISPAARKAQGNVRDTLCRMKLACGEFSWGKTRKLWEKWYVQEYERDGGDTFLKAYRSGKPIQLLKICMLIALSQNVEQMELTNDIMELGIEIVDSIEPDMAKLSIAAGNNELAGPTMMILELLKRNAGMMRETEIKKEINKTLEPRQQAQVLNWLAETELVVRKHMNIDDSGIAKMMVLLPHVYQGLLAQGLIEQQIKRPPPVFGI